MYYLIRFLKSIFCCLQSSVLKVLNINEKSKKNVTIMSQSMPDDGHISYFQLTPNISLVANNCEKSFITDFKLNQQRENFLVVFYAWTGAKKEHVEKYVKILLEKQFDVLVISISPWKLMWPTYYNQAIAADVLKFLNRNECYSQMLIYGLSAGAYMWSESMIQIANDLPQHQLVLDRIVGQIWDSATDVNEVARGLPAAVFRDNKFMAMVLYKYLKVHLKILDRIVTRYFTTASQMFHANIVRAPALSFCSKNDPIGTYDVSHAYIGEWRELGIKVRWIIFEESPHVGHMRKYPDEYTNELNNFLEDLKLNKIIENEEIYIQK